MVAALGALGSSGGAWEPPAAGTPETLGLAWVQPPPVSSGCPGRSNASRGPGLAAQVPEPQLQVTSESRHQGRVTLATLLPQQPTPRSPSRASTSPPWRLLGHPPSCLPASSSGFVSTGTPMAALGAHRVDSVKRQRCTSRVMRGPFTITNHRNQKLDGTEPPLGRASVA